MRPAENIEKLVKNLNDQTSAEMDKRVYRAIIIRNILYKNISVNERAIKLVQPY